MKVFISYSSKDSVQAMSLLLFFKEHNVPYDMDKLYPNLPADNPEELTATLHNAIADCSHIIAVISENTVRSPWVPYEIGFAVAKGLLALTYGMPYFEVPEFLQVWPNLASEKDLKGFFDEINIVEFAEIGPIEERSKFYRRMKRVTGQIL